MKKKQWKESINIIHKKRKIKKNFLLFYNLIPLLLIIILVDLVVVKNKRNIINFDSEIFLIIKGNGTQNLLGFLFFEEPTEVLVNGISKGDTCKTSCFLEGDKNNISLKFYHEINDCSFMFCYCDNIIYIDLSNFNTSNVKNMEWMFSGCSNLE